METLRCATCAEEKPITEFNKDSHAKRGYRSSCKDCRTRKPRPAVSRLGEVRKRAASSAGMTLEDYETAIAKPCAVCGNESADGAQSNGVYLNRVSGAPSGTICQRCATGLGFFGHDAERLRRALSLLG